MLLKAFPSDVLSSHRTHRSRARGQYAGVSTRGSFLPSNWEWTGLFAKHVRACVKPITAHMAGCMDFTALEVVLRSAPGASADAPGERAVQVVARADVANEVSAPGAVYVSRDVELIRAARARSKRARKM